MYRQESAETLALRALGWLAGNDELLPVFFGSTGFSPVELRDRASEPEVLAAVLDFLLMDDGWVVACCNDLGLPYDAPLKARAALPGGEAAHWT